MTPPPSKEERDLLRRIRKEFKASRGERLNPGMLHTFLDESHVTRRLVSSLVNRPCTDNLTCTDPGPLSGAWFSLTTAPSSWMCTSVDCDKITGVCSCETKNEESPIIEGSLIYPSLEVCHEGNILSGVTNLPDFQTTITLYGTVKSSGSPGILGDHVSFTNESRIDLSCGPIIISVVGDGTVTDDSRLNLTPDVEGNWRATEKVFFSCGECPPPGNLSIDCVSNGGFRTLIFPPSMQQSSSTSLDAGAWGKVLAQDYKSLGLNLKCTLRSKTSSTTFINGR